MSTQRHERQDIRQIPVQQILQSGAELTDQALDRLLPAADAQPASIHAALRHTVFAGGKRLRPILCMEAARMVADRDSLPAGVEDLGAAIEMLHTYSLVHDDLPALDNDDLRRGKPTCHVMFGEAVAILAGDALQTLAYQTLAGLKCPAQATVAIVGDIARATGTIGGMIGGQVLDLEGEGKTPTEGIVRAIHQSKTGALIKTSLVTGALYAGGGTIAVEHLRIFGQRAGLAFQIVDDVLDVTESSEQLGKTAGKDSAAVKATWPAVFGIQKSIEDAEGLIDSAFAELADFGPAAGPLKAVARYLVERRH